MAFARTPAAPASPSPPIDEQLASLSLGQPETADDILGLLSERERPRLCPLRQPHDAELHDRIEARSTSSAARAALHLLNDDFIAVHESCHTGLLHERERDDGTCRLVFAIVHRREKLYLEAEEMWKALEHPLLDALYGAHGGPLKFQRAVEGADGKRTGEAKRAPLEEVQFAEMKAVARWVIDHAAGANCTEKVFPKAQLYSTVRFPSELLLKGWDTACVPELPMRKAGLGSAALIRRCLRFHD